MMRLLQGAATATDFALPQPLPHSTANCIISRNHKKSAAVAASTQLLLPPASISPSSTCCSSRKPFNFNAAVMHNSCGIHFEYSFTLKLFDSLPSRQPQLVQFGCNTNKLLARISTANICVVSLIIEFQNSEFFWSIFSTLFMLSVAFPSRSFLFYFIYQIWLL